MIFRTCHGSFAEQVMSTELSAMKTCWLELGYSIRTAPTFPFDGPWYRSEIEYRARRAGGHYHEVVQRNNGEF